MLTCQHEKCKYYKEHEFNESYAKCEISPVTRSFKKGSNIQCELIDRIEDTKNFLSKIENEYMKLQLQEIRSIIDDGYDYVDENDSESQTDFIRGMAGGMGEICDLIDFIIDVGE